MNADPPAGLGPGTPGLDQLLGLLTAGPTPDELARRDATLAMYRQNIRPVAPRRRTPAPRRMRFALAAAAAVVAFAVAAYAEALPGPVQHVAYRVLGFAGVPDAPRHSSVPAPRRSASPRPGKKARAHPGPVTLTLTTTDTQIAAGADAAFTGYVTQHGQGVSGVPVGLFERAAGQHGRHLAATATTGAGGQAVLHVAGLTANARFWLAGPHHAHSKPVRVIVIPAVSVSLTSGPRRRAAVLTAQSREGGQGDAVVLQVQRGGSWQNLRIRRLNGQGLTRFAIRRHSVARVYRVVMIATAAHARSVSNQVSVPGR